jgi:hypothetical protein
MTGHAFLDVLFVLLITSWISRFCWKIYGSIISKRYNIELRPKFNGSMDLDKKHIKALILNASDVKMKNALKTILVLRAVSRYSFLILAFIMISILMLGIFS